MIWVDVGWCWSLSTWIWIVALRFLMKEDSRATSATSLSWRIYSTWCSSMETMSPGWRSNNLLWQSQGRKSVSNMSMKAIENRSWLWITWGPSLTRIQLSVVEFPNVGRKWCRLRRILVDEDDHISSVHVGAMRSRGKFQPDSTQKNGETELDWTYVIPSTPWTHQPRYGSGPMSPARFGKGLVQSTGCNTETLKWYINIAGGQKSPMPVLGDPLLCSVTPESGMFSFTWVCPNLGCPSPLPTPKIRIHLCCWSSGGSPV